MRPGWDVVVVDAVLGQPPRDRRLITVTTRPSRMRRRDQLIGLGVDRREVERRLRVDQQLLRRDPAVDLDVRVPELRQLLRRVRTRELHAVRVREVRGELDPLVDQRPRARGAEARAAPDLDAHEVVREAQIARALVAEAGRRARPEARLSFTLTVNSIGIVTSVATGQTSSSSANAPEAIALGGGRRLELGDRAQRRLAHAVPRVVDRTLDVDREALAVGGAVGGGRAQGLHRRREALDDDRPEHLLEVQVTCGRNHGVSRRNSACSSPRAGWAPTTRNASSAEMPNVRNTKTVSRSDALSVTTTA